MNFASYSISSSNDWRKRRKFMDTARPLLASLVPRYEERIFEDSLFSEIGLGEEGVSQLLTGLEQAFNIHYDPKVFRTKALDLASAFEISLGLPNFLPELNERPTESATLASLGVPLWLPEEQKFVLHSSPQRSVELHYDRSSTSNPTLANPNPTLANPTGGKEVLFFTRCLMQGGQGKETEEMAETIFSFALSEVVRRDARAVISPSCAPLKDYLANNPGWNPYVY